jgi:hypothetical protein
MFDVTKFEAKIASHPEILEGSDTFRFRPPGMSVEAKVRVNDDLPRPRDWELGYFQIMEQLSANVYFSPDRRREIYLGTCPCTDSGLEAAIPFVRRDGISYEKGLKHGKSYHLLYGDVPSLGRSFFDDSQEKRAVIYADYYLRCADWLVARDTVSNEVVYLKHFRWETQMAVAVSPGAPMGHRLMTIELARGVISADNHFARVWDVGDGVGSVSPAPAFRMPNGYSAQQTRDTVIRSEGSGFSFSADRVFRGRVDRVHA